MIMNVKKRLCTLTRIVLPAVGFALTCIGAYLVSRENLYDKTLRIVPAYIMIVFGFIAILSGVFWTICNSMKQHEIYVRDRRQQPIQVFTVERPSSFPPSYEESQVSQGHPDSSSAFMVVVDGVDVALGLAPPLYCQDSSEVPDCTWSWEPPPRYSQVEREPQRTPAAEEQSEAASAH